MTFPPDFTHPNTKVVTAYRAADAIAGLVPAHRAVVQAGGCVGLWPLALSRAFEVVYTFEPEPTNFRYLHANVSELPNIAARQCALGERSASVGMTRPKAQAGLWRVDGEGDIPMVPLDDVIGDTPVDAIVLDVEGAEVPAWRGAMRLIETYRPLLWFEYLSHTSDIDAFLAAQGYTAPRHAVGGDCYSVHVSRAH